MADNEVTDKQKSAPEAPDTVLLEMLKSLRDLNISLQKSIACSLASCKRRTRGRLPTSVALTAAALENDGAFAPAMKHQKEKSYAQTLRYRHLSCER